MGTHKQIEKHKWTYKACTRFGDSSFIIFFTYRVERHTKQGAPSHPPRVRKSPPTQLQPEP